MNVDGLAAALVSHGLPAASAQAIASHAASLESPASAWSYLTQNLLTPQDDFTLHEAIYAACYGQNALLRAPGPAWLPTPEIIDRANVTAAARELGLRDYNAFHRWSVQNRAAYWELVCRRLSIAVHTPWSRMLDDTSPTRPQWMVGARLNIVQSCFGADPGATAIIEGGPTGGLRTICYGLLFELVGGVSLALMQTGINRGDAVAMIGPMSIDTVTAYLAVIAAGAAVVSIPDSFSPEEIATRLRIAGAKLVITQGTVPWGAKHLPLYEKVQAATSLPIVVIGESPSVLRSGDRRFAEFLSPDDRYPGPLGCTPHDPINILFSSGTTGEPKAIPWDHTTPIKAAADAHFHHDLHPGDVACWPTNLGWMMGPWLIFASLINRGTVALYQQAPHDRAFGEFVQNAGVTMLGCVPSLVRAWRQSECMRGLDWSRLRAFSSSGECSNAADMLYLMHLAGYRPIIEYCGGTEIGGAYITSTVVEPNTPATFTTPALGIEMAVYDQGRPARVGEVYLAGPSMGLSTRLLNRDHDEVYFKNTPAARDGTPLRRHGDEIESLPDGSYRIAGRADDTMNLGGIKVGCAEIERVLNALPNVQETAAIALAPPGGGPSRLVVFAVVRSAAGGDLKAEMQKAIRSQLNPLFHLEEVRLVAALPRTASNKIMRRELRALAKH